MQFTCETSKILATAALLISLLTTGEAAPPITITPTTNTSVANATSAGFFGSIYNFKTVTGTYSVPNILNPMLNFDPVQVGTYAANPANGIHYGVPSSADNQLLTTWLGTDGSTVVYTAPHITKVFDTAAGKGTLLSLTGYIEVKPAMLNTPLTLTLGLDDGGLLVINGTTVIDNGGIHAAATINQAVIFTRAGLYPIDLGYYDGHATQALLTAAFGGAQVVSTPNGVALTSIPLDANATSVNQYVMKVVSTMPTDPTLNSALNALANLGINGADPVTYGNALKEMSPLKYGELNGQMAGAVDFITNDLDDYLAHRRDDAGTFRAGNGLDLGGMSVLGGYIDPGLQNVASHLLASNSGTNSPKEMSDSSKEMVEPSERPDTTQRWNVFSRGIVVLSQNLSNRELGHSDAVSGTLQIGADYQVSPNFLVGAFFEYARSSASLDNEGSSSTANSYIPGIYASYTKDGWYGNALAAGGVNQFDVTRNIEFAGFKAGAHSKPDGDEEYVYISGGKDFHMGNWTFGPTTGLQYVHSNLDSFTESGAGGLDLDVNSDDNDSLRSRLGGRIYYAASDGDITWRPFLDASWQHEFMENSNNLTSQFDGSAAGTFTVTSPNNSRESALISVGTDIDIDRNTTVFTAYRVEAGSSNFFAQSVEAGFKLTF